MFLTKTKKTSFVLYFCVNMICDGFSVKQHGIYISDVIHVSNVRGLNRSLLMCNASGEF